MIPTDTLGGADKGKEKKEAAHASDCDSSVLAGWSMGGFLFVQRILLQQLVMLLVRLQVVKHLMT